MSEESLEDLIKYYEELGLLNFIDGGNAYLVRDLNAARQIVEGYFQGQILGHSVRREDKRDTLACILNHPFLKNKTHVGSLQTILEKMEYEQVPDEIRKKIYKAVISLAVKEHVLIDGKRNLKATYSELLGVRTFVKMFAMIKDNISCIDRISYLELLGDIRETANNIYKSQRNWRKYNSK